MTTAARLAMLGSVLARRPAYIVYNRDDPSAAELSHLAGQEGVISFGTHQKAECRVAEVELHPKGSAIHLIIDHQTEVALTIQLPGKQMIYNAAAAAAAAYVLHVPIEAIEKGATAQQPLATQFEYVPLQRPYALLLDSALTPGGVAETLETLKHFAKNRLIVMFGAPLGASPTWRPLLGEIVAQHADRVVITDGEYAGDQSPQEVREQLLQGVVAAGGEAKTEEVPDRRAAIKKTVSIARRGDVVVLAGVTARQYRQLGTERLPWSDHKIIDELFEP